MPVIPPNPTRVNASVTTAAAPGPAVTDSPPAPVTQPGTDTSPWDHASYQEFLSSIGRPGLSAPVDARTPNGGGVGATLRAHGVGLAVARPPGAPLFSSPEILATHEPVGAAKAWVEAQLRQPALAATVAKVGRYLVDEGPPPTVKAMFERAIAEAKEQLRATPFADDETRAHHEVAVAFLALGAQCLGGGVPGATAKFPPFLPTGRPNSFDFDASWHLVSQGMFAYLSLFDARYGDGELQKGFFSLAARMDSEGVAHEVCAAYDRVRGELRPLHPETLNEFPDVEFHGWYFPRPKGLSDDEGRAWDEAVRVGDAYEHKGVAAFDYAAVQEGRLAPGPNPKVEGTLHTFSGVKDPAVSVDITANRVGAWVAVSLMRNPHRVGTIPFDNLSVQQRRPMAPPEKISAAKYYAIESVHLADLGGLAGDRASVDRAPHERWATQVGAGAALNELKAKTDTQIDRLYVQDRKKLAHYYASLAVRSLGWRVPLGGGGLESPSFDAHYAYALRASPDVLKQEVRLRFDAIARYF